MVARTKRQEEKGTLEDRLTRNRVFFQMHLPEN